LGTKNRSGYRSRTDRTAGCTEPEDMGVSEVHVLDRMESGYKPDLVRELGATYHSGRVADLGFEPDAIIECTGVGTVIADCIHKIGQAE